MNRVSGLRPSQDLHERISRRQSQNRLTPEQMQREIPLQPSAGGTNRFQGVPQAPQNNQLGELADALSVLSPAVGRYGRLVHEQRIEREQKNIPQYIEELKQAERLGDLKAVQNGELYPELSPPVRRMLQEQMGREAGRQVAGELAHEMLSNTQIRWDTEARQAWVQERMDDILGDMPEGYELWNSGYLQSIQSVVEGKEAQLLNETAERHRQMLTRRWQEESVGAFEAGGWEAVKAHDAYYDEFGPVDRQTRNDKLVEGFIQEAIRRADYSYLDIPERFLNRERAAAIEDAYARIWKDEERRARAEQQRMEQERQERTNAAMDIVLEMYVNGEEPTIAMFMEHAGDIDIQEVSKFIHDWGNRGVIDQHTSAANRDELRHELMLRATIQGTQIGQENFEPLTRQGLRKEIMEADGLNSRERRDLLQEVDTIMDGVYIQRHPVVRDMLDDMIMPEANSLQSELAGRMVRWRNDRYRPVEYARMTFYNNLNNQVETHMIQHGQAPRLADVQVMAERSAQFTMGQLRRLRGAGGTSDGALDTGAGIPSMDSDVQSDQPAVGSSRTRGPSAPRGQQSTANEAPQTDAAREAQQRGFDVR